jgi:hypothetical protein
VGPAGKKGDGLYTVTDEEYYRQTFVETPCRHGVCTTKQAAMLRKLGVQNPEAVRFEDVDRVVREARIANIAPTPSQGQGVHKWLIKSARIMHENGLPADEITRRLTTATAHMKRKNKTDEIAKTVRTVTGTDAPTPGVNGGGAWPDHENERIDSIVLAGAPHLYDAWEQSPRRFDDGNSHCEEIIDIAFPGDPLLCVGLDNYKFATRRREVWRGHLHRFPLIVPNPQLSVYGHTADGKISEHTKEATARPIYQVSEFDFEELDDDGNETVWTPSVRRWKAAGLTIADACAALIFVLAQLLPLFLIVFSGGKSLHGWFLVQHLAKEAIRAFMEEAVKLGACHSTATKSQFIRMPDGRRQNGARQTVFYFNPQNAVKL